jgi:hypothetical protein
MLQFYVLIQTAFRAIVFLAGFNRAAVVAIYHRSSSPVSLLLISHECPDELIFHHRHDVTLQLLGHDELLAALLSALDLIQFWRV